MSRTDVLYNITRWYQILYIVIQTDIEMNSLLQFTLQLFSVGFVTLANVYLYQNRKILSIIRVIFDKNYISWQIWHCLIRFIVALFYFMFGFRVMTLLLQQFYENDWNNGITLSIYDDLDSYSNQEYNIFCEDCHCTERWFWIWNWSFVCVTIRKIFGWTDVFFVVLFVRSILFHAICCTHINKTLTNAILLWLTGFALCQLMLLTV